MDPEHVRGRKGSTDKRWRGKVASELQLGIFNSYFLFIGACGN